jgi:hypothetical protein
VAKDAEEEPPQLYARSHIENHQRKRRTEGLLLDREHLIVSIDRPAALCGGRKVAKDRNSLKGRV